MREYTLTPVDYNPFRQMLKNSVEPYRESGSRADLNKPVDNSPYSGYGVRPPVVAPFLPDYESIQPNSLE